MKLSKTHRTSVIIAAASSGAILGLGGTTRGGPEDFTVVGQSDVGSGDLKAAI